VQTSTPRDPRIWRSLAEIPADLGRTVVVIGNFDGVHLGHQHVIREARAAADAAAVDAGVEAGSIPVVAVTFDPHPMAVLRPEHAPTALTDLATRARLLAGAGVDDVLAIPFDRDIAAWSPHEFAERVLHEALHALVVVVGANFRYGARAAGDVGSLTASGAELGFRAVGVPLDGGPQVWSSTYVRTCLAAGDVAGAAEALGRPFVVRGVVVRGDQRGRELGYPTANVPTSGMAAAPADGVYAGWLRRLDTEETYPAAISVGTNPTFAGERDRRVESYVLDRDDLELYDVEVEVAFVDRIRGMVRFDGVEALVETMADDVARAHEILGVSRP
jgi:riboflavin kinase/FMN adenylyltransferase